MTDHDGRPDGPAALRLDAAGALLLVSADSGSQVLVLLADPVVPTRIRLDLQGVVSTFLRIRRGPLAHGLLEVYRECADVDAADVPACAVSEHTHELVWTADAGRLFGSGDTALLLPAAERGEWAVVSIPSGAIGAARRCMLRRTDDTVFSLVDEVDDEGWICPTCGRLSPNPEPHTSAHGVPGHLRAGSLPGERLDRTRTYAEH